MTEQQISAYIDRMLDHLNRLMLNGDLSEGDYDKAVADLSSWEEEETLKAKGEAE